jgi:hypothetical protein
LLYSSVGKVDVVVIAVTNDVMIDVLSLEIIALKFGIASFL